MPCVLRSAAVLLQQQLLHLVSCQDPPVCSQHAQHAHERQALIQGLVAVAQGTCQAKHLFGFSCAALRGRGAAARGKVRASSQLWLGSYNQGGHEAAHRLLLLLTMTTCTVDCGLLLVTYSQSAAPRDTFLLDLSLHTAPGSDLQLTCFCWMGLWGARNKEPRYGHGPRNVHICTPKSMEAQHAIHISKLWLGDQGDRAY
eukprot:1161192-Pelagomonas_calceolata.AAC.1